MPQVHQDHYPNLFAYIKGHGGHFTNQNVHARELKPVQGEFSVQGVEKMMRGRADIKSGKRPAKRIIVSSDNYIIDGHHRWLAAYNHDDDIDIMRVDIPVKRLMQLLHDFEHTTYKDIYNENKLDVPTPSISAIAKKHNVSTKAIVMQLRKGIKVEMEHTTDRAIAKEIALDHISETPDYYDRLATIDPH